MALTATEAPMLVYNVDYKDELPADERELPGDVGQNISTPGPRKAQITFETDLVGGITHYYTMLYQGCGMGATSPFGFLSSSGTLTIGYYIDGVLRQIAGSVGTFSIVLRPGHSSRIKWEFTGKSIADTDVALISPTLPSDIPPRLAGGSITFGAIHPKFSTVTIAVGNEIYMTEDAEDVTGLGHGVLMARKPNLTMDPEAGTVASFDWQAAAFNRTIYSLSIPVGTVTGNIITISSSTAVVREAPTANRSGIVTRAAKIELVGATPFTITHS